jgi:hypothetical protein
MTLHNYLLKTLDHTAMIALSINDQSSIQYNYWNWFHTIDELHLIKDDFSIGHILHQGSIVENNDGSISFHSQYFPKNCVLNFYFGGSK